MIRRLRVAVMLLCSIGVWGAALEPSCHAEAKIDVKTSDVHAIVIGITNYGGSSPQAKSAKEGAERFMETINETYGASIQKTLLVDEKATYENVAKALHSIKFIKPESLLIVYFSGHAERDESGDLWLRLHGSTPTDYIGRSLEPVSLWKDLFNCKYTNAMIFLDCCYAGSDDESVHLADKTEFLKAHARVFLMCACNKEQQAAGSVFTDSILGVWRENLAHNNCMTLVEFEKAVRKKVKEAGHKHMLPGIPLTSGIARCITKMGEPSAIVAFRFPNGCRAPLNVFFNNALVQEDFEYKKDGAFISQISLHEPLTVRFESDGRTIWGPYVFQPTDFSPKRVLSFSVDVPKEFQSDPKDLLPTASISSDRIAEVAGLYGENATQLYWEAQTDYYRANLSSGDGSRYFIHRAFELDPMNQLLGYVTDNVDCTSFINSLVERGARRNEIFATLRAMETAGLHEKAYAFALTVSTQRSVHDSAKLSQDDVVDLAVRGYVNSKCAGNWNREFELRVSKWLNEVESEPWQAMLVQGISRLRDDEVRTLLPRIPIGSDEWSLRAALKRNEHVDIVRRLSLGDAALENRVLAGKGDGTKSTNWTNWRGMAVNSVVENPNISCTTCCSPVMVTSQGVSPAIIEDGENFVTLGDGSGMVKVYTVNPWSAKGAALCKPGFDVKYDSQRCWIGSFDSSTNGKTISFTIHGGAQCEASNMEVAAEYITSKPGFVSSYKDGRVRIRELGASETNDEEYVEKFQYGELQWENVFDSKESARRYSERVLMIDSSLFATAAVPEPAG